jgi:hypothetical protein
VAAEAGASTPAAANGLAILSPAPQAVLDIASTSITVQSPMVSDRPQAIGTPIELRVNGTLVSDTLIGRTEKDTGRQTITQTWYGVTLKDGENTITVTPAGGTAITTRVQVRGAATQLVLTSAETRVPADGRSTVSLSGQLLDAAGQRSNRDAVVTLKTSAGEFVEPDADTAQPGYQIKAAAGQFKATLRSGIQAQTVRVQAQSDPLEAFTQVQFETNLRSSLLTGSIDFRIGKRGTDFYGSFKDFLPPDRNNKYQLDARGAVFGTGKVGEWLLTGAYNSSRALNQTCDGSSRLFRDQQFCDQNYPVYGDSSKTEVLTPSTDSVYLKFERSAKGTKGIDYGMWGDYNTEEFATKSQQFTATNRQLHGFKANYNIGNVQMTGFYGNNVQGFQRDTVAPDGTSGYYFLSRRLIIGGSENVFLELEELNRPGTVLDRKTLNRGTDYDIDYDRGTLLFRQPILRTDVDQTGQVLVRRIVTTYQYENQASGAAGEKSNIYAGRAVYHLSKNPGQESWIGATYLKQNQGSRNFELYGADALYSFGKGSVVLEYAHSKNQSDILGSVSGSAYRLEANATVATGVQAHAYYRNRLCQ